MFSKNGKKRSYLHNFGAILHALRRFGDKGVRRNGTNGLRRAGAAAVGMESERDRRGQWGGDVANASLEYIKNYITHLYNCRIHLAAP